MTVQWKFSDADPYYVQLDNGSTRAAKGLAEKPDVTLRTSFEKWIEVSSRGGDPRKAMLTGKLRPSGSPRKLMRMQKIWLGRQQDPNPVLSGAGLPE